MKGIIFLMGIALGMFPAFSAQAEKTDITVRVRGHDSKFVGTSMGGVRTVLRHAETGEILAQGMIEGSTGDTEVLMKEPHGRETLLSKGGAAHWTGTIDIASPTPVRLEATGPLVAGTNQLTSSTTLWVLPGRDMTGDGIVLELYGLVVHPVTPGPHQMVKPGEEIALEAHVVMMCGCNIAPDLPWKPEDYEVEVAIRKGDEVIAEIPLEYTGESSRYAGKFTPPEKGAYKIFITAADPEANNFGVGTTTIVVKE